MSEIERVDRRGGAADKDAFAARLVAAMERNGWSQAETARQVAKRLPPECRFHRVHVNHYVRGRATPRGERLKALTAALGLATGAASAASSVEPSTPSPLKIVIENTQKTQISASDMGDGLALLHITETVPWPIALRVLAMLKSISA
jgi:transcriptional regulator with XRE-family HTH domain